MIEMILPVVALAAGGYVAVAGLMYLSQDRLIFRPSRARGDNPGHVGLPYEEVRLRTRDGEVLAAWWVPREDARATVLFFHGNAGNISDRLHTIGLLNSLGLNVFIFDYRGYGESTGRPSEEGLYVDGETAWLHLVEDRGIPPSTIVLHGRSLGGGVASWLAARVDAGALILESSFTSIPDAGVHHYPYLPVRLLSRLRFESASLLGRCRLPVLITHSPDDEVIPFAHGVRLFQVANEPKSFLRLRGSHAEACSTLDENYREALDRFLTGHL